MKITIINGPNLNLLGTREPEVYGSQSFEDFLSKLKASFGEHEISYFQSNIEGEIINYLQQAGAESDGVILNPAGYTHTSVAIADAIAAIAVPVIEVHISNIFARETFRHQSMTISKSVGAIMGLGLEGYRLALLYLTEEQGR